VNSDVPVIRVAAAVILDARGHMLVVRKRSTAAFMQPGGKIMPGESAVDALHREIAEERRGGRVERAAARSPCRRCGA